MERQVPLDCEEFSYHLTVITSATPDPCHPGFDHGKARQIHPALSWKKCEITHNQNPIQKLECIGRMHYGRMGLCTEHLCWPDRTGKQLRLRRTKMLPQGVSLFVCLLVLAWTGRALAGKNLSPSILGQHFLPLFTDLQLFDRLHMTWTSVNLSVSKSNH